MAKHFNYKKRNLLSGPHLLGILLLLVGLFTLASPLYLKTEVPQERVIIMGAGAVVLGLLIVSSYTGTLVDTFGNRYKDYLSVAGIIFGEWAELPLITQVRLKGISRLHTNTANGISPTLSGKVKEYTVGLNSDSGRPEFVFTYKKEKTASAQAAYLASALNAELITDKVRTTF